MDMTWDGFLWGAVVVVGVCAFMCMFRVVRGPTAPDRALGIDILGVLLVGICGIVALLVAPGIHRDDRSREASRGETLR
jgi:multisubunit Na+/H+ antiporter MnhF subunit